MKDTEIAEEMAKFGIMPPILELIDSKPKLKTFAKAYQDLAEICDFIFDHYWHGISILDADSGKSRKKFRSEIPKMGLSSIDASMSLCYLFLIVGQAVRINRMVLEYQGKSKPKATRKELLQMKRRYNEAWEFLRLGVEKAKHQGIPR